MFWILVLACGGVGTGPEVSPGGGGSIFEQDETPTFPADPPPEGAVVTPYVPTEAPSKNVMAPAKVPQASVEVSDACRSARARLDAAEEGIVRLRNRKITPAADRFDDATEIMGRCVRDVIGCGNRAGAYKKDLVAAEVAYEKALDLVAVEEAGLFPLNQAVKAACYSQ